MIAEGLESLFRGEVKRIEHDDEHEHDSANFGIQD